MEGLNGFGGFSRILEGFWRVLEGSAWFCRVFGSFVSSANEFKILKPLLLLQQYFFYQF